MNLNDRLRTAFAQAVAQTATAHHSRHNCLFPDRWWADWFGLEPLTAQEQDHIRSCARCRRTRGRFEQQRAAGLGLLAGPVSAREGAVGASGPRLLAASADASLTVSLEALPAGLLVAHVQSPHTELAGRTAIVELSSAGGSSAAKVVLEAQSTGGCAGRHVFGTVAEWAGRLGAGTAMRANLTDAPAPPSPSPAPPGKERAPMSSLQAGMTVNGFRLIKRLGIGGFGQVWKAKDPVLDRDMALKLLPRQLPGLSEAETEQFVRKEAQRRVRLRVHADVPVLFQFERYHAAEAPDAFGWVLVMEYVDGGTLEEELTRLRMKYCKHPDWDPGDGDAPDPADAALPWNRLAEHIDYQAYLSEHLERMVHLVVGIAKTAKALHEDQILHLDIKPSNILVTPEGKAYLFDLGAGRLLRPQGSATTTLPVFTRSYASAEQWRQEPDLDARSDVFSLGATLYHVLCLFPPYALVGPGLREVGCCRHSADDLPVHVREINPELDEHLARIARRAMSADRLARYQSIDELLNALHEWLAWADGVSHSVPTQPLSEALRAFGDLLAERSQPTAEQFAGLIPYSSVSSGGLSESQCLRLVHLGLLRMEPGGYCVPALGRGGANTFLRRNDEEWVEKYASGHLTTLLLEQRGYETIGVDAGSTTLWVLRALVFHDMAGHLLPSEIYTNSPMGLSLTINLGLRTDWYTAAGKLDRRTNALVEGVVESMRAMDLHLDAAVIGVNALRAGEGPGLATTSGREGPIKELLIEQARRELIVVSNPAKFGEAGHPLKATTNLPHLLQQPERRITLVTAHPHWTSAEQPQAYHGRVVRFFTHLDAFLAAWPEKWRLSLYAIPISPGRMARVQSLADVTKELDPGARERSLRERIVTFRRSLPEDMVVCVLLEYEPRPVPPW
jgi:serine/threonine protein kinase/DeoR/GlpR family transcriptional regulator of sugar metabolism